MPAPSPTIVPETLRGVRVLLAGKLASMSRRDAQQLIRRQGGTIAESLADGAQCVVVGEGTLPLDDAEVSELLAAVERMTGQPDAPEVVAESLFWQRLGLIDEDQHVRRLYTPAMLAELLGLPVAIIRGWHRRGLIVPTREVRKLPYFDFQEVTTARRLAELLAAGASPQAIEKKLAALRRVLPNVERPLAQLPVLVEGQELLLRQGGGLVESGGQRRFDFEASPAAEPAEREASGHVLLEHDFLEQAGDILPLELAVPAAPTAGPQQLIQWAADLDDAGRLSEAAEMYRAALAAGGANAELCFRLAEVLYRRADLSAARERYYMAVELNEDYVEARANLGCVLAELGERELAVAAFHGALVFHPDYPDVHYQLARTLDDLGRADEAAHHWRTFLSLAPDSPWSDEARQRLDGEPA